MGTAKTIDFAILTVGRTGSHLLASLLNSHPQIGCYGELQTLDAHNKDDIRIDPNKVSGAITGCIVPYPMWRRLDEFDKVIFCTRKNKEDHARSYAKNIKKRTPTTGDIEWAKKELDKKHKHIIDILDCYLCVSYESITKGEDIREARLDTILDFLGAEKRTLTTNLIKGET